MVYSIYKFKEVKTMDNNIKFSVALENLERKIAELNIKISKDLNNQVLKHEHSRLLNNKDMLLKGTDSNIIESLINEYGNK